jgi:hypothetical protein
MMFFLRAAFWLAIVSVFVPQGFAGEAVSLPFDTSAAHVDAEVAVSDWCADREAICETGAEAVQFGGLIAQFAMTRIEAAIEDNQDDNS